MELLTLFAFIFACYGFSNIVVYSSLFSGFRELMNKLHSKLGELVSCMMCFPTWAGMILSAINLFLIQNIMFTPMNLLFSENIFDYYDFTFWITAFIIILVDGLIGSATTWLIHTIQEHFEK